MAEVAFGHGGGHVGNVPHLRSQVGGHVVHVVGQVFPDAGHIRHHGLAAQPALGAHFLGHAGHFAREQVQRVHHLVQVLLQLQELPFYIDGDFLAQIALGHGSGHVGNVPHLHGEVGSHVVHVIGQVFPDAANVGYRSLTAEFTLGAHFLGHAGYFAGKNIQVINRLINGFGHQLEVARHRNLEAFVQIATADVLQNLAHFQHRHSDAIHQTVDIINHIPPEAGGTVGRSSRFQVAFYPGHLRNARNFAPHPANHFHHGIICFGDFSKNVVVLLGQSHRYVTFFKSVERIQDPVELVVNIARVLGINRTTRTPFFAGQVVVGSHHIEGRNCAEIRSFAGIFIVTSHRGGPMRLRLRSLGGSHIV